MAGKSWHLVAYDVSDKRRLQKVHRYLKQEGIALQYSVFLIEVTKQEYADITDGLLNLTCRKEDDVRFYPCQSEDHIWMAGRATDYWIRPDKKTKPGKQKNREGKRLWFWQ